MKKLQPFQQTRVLHLKAGGRYTLQFARSAEEVRQAQALRFEVFNRELNEGLDTSVPSQLDADVYDAVCDHLLVRDVTTHRVVGTYRMQTGSSAWTNYGYYCAQEFDLLVFESVRAQTLELGRACIDKDHRNFQVLSMLWRGIALYAREHNARYLIGCSSLTSQNPADGITAYQTLQAHLAPHAFVTLPHAGYACVMPATCLPLSLPLPLVKIPKLLSAYLALGAWVCGPPALDTEFKTIDFLTLMDLQSEDMHLRRKRFGISN